MSTASPTEASRGGRIFWVAGVVLYLLPLFLLALQSEGGWSTSPFLMVTYGLVSLSVFGLLLRPGDVREVVVEKVVETPSKALEGELADREQALEERDRRIVQLEGKVSELSKEIRTLLQLEGQQGARPIKALAFEVDNWVEEMPESSSQEVRTQYDAHVLLQRCIQKAQSLGGSHQREAPRFARLAFDHPPLDMRRLCDALRDEMAAAVLLFSPADGKLLFANNVVRAYTGYNPERFVRDFGHILGSSISDWEQAIEELDASPETSLRLPLQSEEGRRFVFECCMGMVPTGPFEGMVISILYRC